MNKSTYLFCGAAVVAAGVIGGLSLRSKAAAPPDAPRMDAPVSPVGVSPAPSSQSPTLPASAASLSAARPVTPQELQQVVGWLQDRGYSRAARSTSGGEVVTTDAFSGYDAASDASLTASAQSGDQRAAMVLALRLRAKYGEDKIPPTAARDEIVRLLLDASMRGYTASIEQLVLLKQTEAIGGGVQQRIEAPAVNTEALLEGYKYAYLLETRGDLGKGVYLHMLQNTQRLSASDEAAARQAAAALHAQMNTQRTSLGLPPFSDGIPAEITDIAKRQQVGGGQ